MKPEILFASQNILGEGPIWNSDEQAIYWVDIDGRKIQRYFPETKKYEAFEMPLKISLIAFRSKGGMVLGTENGLYFWDVITRNLSFISHPEKGKTEARFNDGKVDRKGRLWAGTMTFKGASSSLYRMDTDLSLRQMESGITISNGIGWSPDNKIMYYVDSRRFVIYAYDFDLQKGNISERRIFVQLDGSTGTPDGMTVDSEGSLWVSLYGGWKVQRYSPSGKLINEIEFPVSKPSSCTFGGMDSDELFITTISEGLSPAEKNNQPNAGDLFVLKTNIKGIPEPKFEG
jgi:sugar lactone lactonase YvrE